MAEDDEEEKKEENEKIYETLERMIEEFAKKDVDEQSSSFIDFLKLFDDLRPRLLFTPTLQIKVKLLLSLKFEFFISLDTKDSSYNNVRDRFYNCVRFSLTNDVINGIKSISDNDKISFSRTVDNLLNALIAIFYKNNNTDVDTEESVKKNLIEIEILLEKALIDTALIVGIVTEKEREKEKTITSDLETQAENFSKKGKDYRNNSRWFLGGVVIFICLIALLQFYTLSRSPNGELDYVDLEQGDYLYFYVALKTLLSSSILLSVAILVGLFACIRFYAASNHNAIVCDQRANTLKSYKALRDSAKTDEERRLVLQKVLDSATDHQATGFSKQGGDESASVIGKIATFLTKSAK